MKSAILALLAVLATPSGTEAASTDGPRGILIARWEDKNGVPREVRTNIYADFKSARDDHAAAVARLKAQYPPAPN